MYHFYPSFSFFSAILFLFAKTYPIIGEIESFGQLTDFHAAQVLGGVEFTFKFSHLC